MIAAFARAKSWTHPKCLLIDEGLAAGSTYPPVKLFNIHKKAVPTHAATWVNGGVCAKKKANHKRMNSV